MDYVLHILILMEIYAILAMSLNLVVGYLGILSVAHGALFGIAAYAFGILTVKLSFPFWIAFPLALVPPALTGLLLALPALRLRDDYLALATFAFAIAAYDILNNLTVVTEGPMGISAIPRPNIFQYEFDEAILFLALSSSFFLLTYIIIDRAVDSPWGRILRGIRDQEMAVLVSGKDITHYKVVTFVVSSIFAGVAGVLYASYLSYIHPTSFLPMLSILLLCMVVLGGLGNLKGSILGAFLLLLIPEILRFLDVSSSLSGNIQQFIFGFMLVILMLFRPQGLLGDYQIRSR